MNENSDDTDDTKQSPWLKRARDAYTSSTTYFDANIRKQIEADLRQASGRHPAGSKYYSDVYKARSKLYRPKTRAAIRKNEAIAAAAFFSTDDVVNITPQDDSNKVQLASAKVMHELMQYRLKKSIPWFQVCIGAYQDAQTVGVVCSKQYWEYRKKEKIDRPCIDLRPVENVRIDPGAKWYDPINTSPYVIDMLPMYVADIKQKMVELDEKTQQPKWKPYSDGQILSAIKNSYDSIRATREDSRADSTENPTAVTDFTIAWVHENYMRHNGEEFVFYTLGTEFLLTDPAPLESVYFHGRPLVMGACIIETHKVYPSSIPRMTKDIATEINEVANQRIDNVKFAMNKRYFVKRNQQVDIRSLTRNVPASVTLMNDPDKDVKILETNDVTSSSYQEQDRLNLDFDDMAGNFSQSSVQSNRNLNETVGGMNILSSNSSQMSEYQLRTFSETWVEPVLRHLVKLEQYYETDEAILTLAGNKAQLVQKFGIDAITDDMLMQEFTINVNVGTGSTDPQKQVERFMFGMNSLTTLLGSAVMQKLNAEEVIIETFGKLGYKDGKRFFNLEDDPKYAQLEGMIQELQAALNAKNPPELVAAQVKKIEAEIAKIKAGSVKEGVESAFAAMQAGQVIVTMPQVAPVADSVMQSAGYQPPVPAGVDPNYPQPSGIPAPPLDVNQNTSPVLPPVPESAMRGVETPRFEQ